MEEKQLTPEMAFDIVYNATSALALNREEGKLLDASLLILAGLLPLESVESQDL